MMGLSLSPRSALTNLSAESHQRLVSHLEQTGSKSKLAFLPLPGDDPRVRRPDITLAGKLLGWKPEIPLDEGLRRTIEYFKGII